MDESAEGTASVPSRAGGDLDLDEQVDEASSESFPASDPPQWWSGPRRRTDRPS